MSDQTKEQISTNADNFNNQPDYCKTPVIGSQSQPKTIRTDRDRNFLPLTHPDSDGISVKWGLCQSNEGGSMWALLED